MWISPYFNLRHFMLIVIRNPKGAIVNNNIGSSSSESPCVVLFLYPMGEKIEYRRQRVLLMVTTFLGKYFNCLQNSGKMLEACSFDEKGVVMRKVNNIPLQSNLPLFFFSVVSYLKTILDNKRALLKKHVSLI
ncbi:hypothetical protein GCK72_023050 [Caenorhabditis remanei]|uniref:Uncharacterized protein n=1 Tax=Caenorhabditis remanei TaxID=31234 RepID=A0A6A5FVM2_CAERE|nr:hypothetical protein GCK72_023050 [Caenorhabditis remanei]KAF1746593.1 hypothetical protein GCK72_023050 [Caenorhabditis remanei]